MDNRHLPWRRVVREKGVICRACARYRECSSNIFISTDAFNIPVFGLLRDLLNVKVEEGDGLPDTICRKCVNKLVEFDEFKRMYVSSQTELRKRNEFKWLLEEEVRPWEEFAEEESCAEDGFQKESTANHKSTLNGIGFLHPLKEEEVERNSVAAEEMKREKDSAEDLNSGRTSTLNMDPFRGELKNEAELSELVGNGDSHSTEIIDEDNSSDTGGPSLLSDNLAVMNMTNLRCSQSSLIKKESDREDVFSDSDLLEMGFAGFDVTSPASGNEVGATSNDRDSCDVDRSAVTPIPNVTLEPMVAISCNESGDFSRNQGQMPGNMRVIELGTSPNNSTSISRDGHLRQGDDSMNNAKSHSLTLMPNSEQKFIENRRLTRKSQKCCEIPAINISRECYGQGNETVNMAPHEDSVKDLTKYTCDYCRITFTDKKSLYFHIEEHTAERMITSEKVSRRVSLKIPQLIISRIDQNFKLLSNGTGEKILNKVTNLASQSKAPKGMLLRDKCGNELNKMSTLAKHRTIHSGISFKCQVCGKEFYCKSNFVAHTAIHSAEKPHKCEVCGMSFNVKRKLVRHSRVHEKPSSFDCDSCGRKFRRKSNLSSHITIRCGKGKHGPFKCDKCGKEFNKKSTSIKHRSVHSGVKFKCELCGKEFYWKSNYISHIVVHSEKKPFKCETCGKHFKLKSNLTRHCVVHNDRRPFRCDVCGKYFKHKGYLVIHMDIHTGVKKFKCEICLKEFNQRCKLNRHSVTHNKLKAFKCDSCLMEFNRKCNLKRHCQKYCH